MGNDPRQLGQSTQYQPIDVVTKPHKIAKKIRDRAARKEKEKKWLYYTTVFRLLVSVLSRAVPKWIKLTNSEKMKAEFSCKSEHQQTVFFIAALLAVAILFAILVHINWCSSFIPDDVTDLQSYSGITGHFEEQKCISQKQIDVRLCEVESEQRHDFPQICNPGEPTDLQTAVNIKSDMARVYGDEEGSFCAAQVASEVENTCNKPPSDLCEVKKILMRLCGKLDANDSSNLYDCRILTRQLIGQYVIKEPIFGEPLLKENKEIIYCSPEPYIDKHQFRELHFGNVCLPQSISRNIVKDLMMCISAHRVEVEDLCLSSLETEKNDVCFVDDEEFYKYQFSFERLESLTKAPVFGCVPVMQIAVNHIFQHGDGDNVDLLIVRSSTLQSALDGIGPQILVDSFEEQYRNLDANPLDPRSEQGFSARVTPNEGSQSNNGDSPSSASGQGDASNANYLVAGDGDQQGCTLACGGSGDGRKNGGGDKRKKFGQECDRDKRKKLAFLYAQIREILLAFCCPTCNFSLSLQESNQLPLLLKSNIRENEAVACSLTECPGSDYASERTIMLLVGELGEALLGLLNLMKSRSEDIEELEAAIEQVRFAFQCNVCYHSLYGFSPVRVCSNSHPLCTVCSINERMCDQCPFCRDADFEYVWLPSHICEILDGRKIPRTSHRRKRARQQPIVTDADDVYKPTKNTEAIDECDLPVYSDITQSRPKRQYSVTDVDIVTNQLPMEALSDETEPVDTPPPEENQMSPQEKIDNAQGDTRQQTVPGGDFSELVLENDNQLAIQNQLLGAVGFDSNYMSHQHFKSLQEVATAAEQTQCLRQECTSEMGTDSAVGTASAVGTTKEDAEDERMHPNQGTDSVVGTTEEVAEGEGVHPNQGTESTDRINEEEEAEGEEMHPYQDIGMGVHDELETQQTAVPNQVLDAADEIEVDASGD